MKPIAKLTKRERAAILKDPAAKLSDLLEIAALDAIALQKQKRVKFDMSVYVEPPGSADGHETKCTVCLAGAALHRDLGFRSYWNKGSNYTIRENAARINLAREGVCNNNETATRILSAAIDDRFSNFLGRAPFRVYIRAAHALRKAGM